MSIFKKLTVVLFAVGVFSYIAHEAFGNIEQGITGITSPAYAVRSAKAVEKLPIDEQLKRSINEDTRTSNTRYIGGQGEIVIVVD